MKIKSDKPNHQKQKSINPHTYAIGFYDAFDGWYYPSETHAKKFTSLDKAKAECDKKMKDLGKNNKNMGEHYSVFDENDKAIYRGH